jgi:hypothetical protein
MNWFEVKVKYGKTFENGVFKKVSEWYLVDAETCTEAEARSIENLSFADGELEVKDIRSAAYNEVFLSQGEKFYKVKVSFITLDEKSGAEKQTNTYTLVQADDLREAIKNLDEEMKGTICDYRILSVQETSIVDVIMRES